MEVISLFWTPKLFVVYFSHFVDNWYTFPLNIFFIDDQSNFWNLAMSLTVQKQMFYLCSEFPGVSSEHHCVTQTHYSRRRLSPPARPLHTRSHSILFRNPGAETLNTSIVQMKKLRHGKCECAYHHTVRNRQRQFGTNLRQLSSRVSILLMSQGLQTYHSIFHEILI